MDYVSLGKSNLMVSRTAFGAQALGAARTADEASALVKIAYDDGVNFFDTSNLEQESEKRLGAALAPVRENVIIATKTSAYTSEEITDDIDQSLRNLQTDYIDLYQLEKPTFLPGQGGADGVVEKLVNLKKAGVIRHFGVATESPEVAQSMLTSDVPWETVQFPFNMLCDEETESLVAQFAAADIGFIAMRPLCGGLLTNIPLALGYLRQFEGVVPVWGARNAEELRQILYFTQSPPNIDDRFHEECEKIRAFFN